MFGGQHNSVFMCKDDSEVHLIRQGDRVFLSIRVMMGEGAAKTSGTRVKKGFIVSVSEEVEDSMDIQAEPVIQVSVTLMIMPVPVERPLVLSVTRDVSLDESGGIDVQPNVVPYRP